MLNKGQVARGKGQVNRMPRINAAFRIACHSALAPCNCTRGTMENAHSLPESARLTGVVHSVRDRWRMKRALRGASIVVAAAFVLLVGSAFALDRLHYGHTALVVTRVIVLVVITVLAAIFVVAP